LEILIGALLLFGLYLTTQYSYLLFHSIAELFSIVIAAGIFILLWNSRRFVDNSYLLFIGIAYLFVGVLDTIHTLAYTGMGVFPEYGTDLATELWISARYVESFSLLLAPILLGRKLKAEYVILGYFLVSTLLLLSIFYWDIFPNCFIEGVGLTTFKKISEYFICLILLASAYLVIRRRSDFDSGVLKLVLASIIVTIASEMSFTFYVHAYAFPNLVGHLLKIISFYLIYKAIIEKGLREPYDLMFRDLKRSEETLREERNRVQEYNARLETLNEQKNQFLGMAAHDLRSPLSIIIIYSRFLLDEVSGSLDAEHREFLSIIHSSSEFMLQMVDDLLDITTIESGKLQLSVRPTDLKEVIDYDISLNRVLASKKHIDLIFHCDKDIPMVMVDESKIKQVLSNLIGNAIKFSHPESKVEVFLDIESDHVVVSIKDEGQGVPAEESDKIFRPFARSSVREPDGEKSSGLGLSIARRIVEGHKGKIWFDSEAGSGSTFYFSIPINIENGIER